MNRFEELGVARNASSTEIRQAYRNLVRLIHPDRCPDPQVRHLAELQMQRLNETVEILLDPVRRRRYEAEIDRQNAAAPPPIALLEQAFEAGKRESNTRIAAWCLLGGMAAASFFWFLREDDSSPRNLARGPDAAFSQTAAENKERALAGRIDELEDRLSALEQKPQVPEAPKAPGIAGKWIYRSELSLLPSLGDLAAEKRIEVTIAEQNGVVRGTYDSGYEVSNGPLSPIISFRFDGKPNDGLLAWNGSQGVTGNIQLRLLGANELMAAWWEREAGGRSDTTILHRATVSEY